MENNDLDKLFREKLRNRKASFDPKAWERAEAALNNAAPKSGGVPAGYKYAAATALLAASIFAGYLLTDSPENEAVAEATQIETPAERPEKDHSEHAAETSSDELEGSKQNADDQQNNEAESNTELESDAGQQGKAPTDEQQSANNSEIAHSQNSNSNASSESDVNTRDAYNDDTHSSTGSDQNTQNNAVDQAAVDREDNTAASQQTEERKAETNLRRDEPMSLPLKGQDRSATEIKQEFDEDPKDVHLLAELPDLNPLIKNRVSVIAGVSGSRGVRSGTRPNEWTADIMLGLGYEYILDHNWSVDLNALYRERSNSGLSHQRTFTQYGFGSETVTLNYENTKSRYLEIPLMVNYRRNAKHTFQAGASAGFLLSSDDRWDYESQTLFDDQPEQRQLMPSEGEANSEVNNLDIALQAGYQYDVLPGFAVGARVSHSLTDYSKNLNYDNEVNHKNFFLSGYLRYHLFNF